MMRKSLLRQHADRYLKEDNRGSCRDKSYRRFVLHNMINALFAIGEVPPKWYALESTHLQKLVKYWKEKNITPATIMKYMTVIRQFLQAIGHYPIDIDNKSLGLIRELLISFLLTLVFLRVEFDSEVEAKCFFQHQG